MLEELPLFPELNGREASFERESVMTTRAA